MNYTNLLTSILLGLSLLDPSMAQLRSNRELDTCNLDLKVSCSVAGCESVSIATTKCSQRPLSMQFKYKGGSCQNSFNAQVSGNQFLCSDYSGGPPSQVGESNYIVVTSTNRDVVYHQAMVEVGSFFSLDSDELGMEANLLLMIYTSSDAQAELLQAVEFHSSCAGDTLWLYDRFGSFLLSGWTNEEQGTVSAMVEVSNVGGEESVSLSGLSLASSQEPFSLDLNESVEGVEVAAGSSFTTTVTVPIDTTEELTQMAFSLEGNAEEGSNCAGTAKIDFVVNLPAL